MCARRILKWCIKSRYKITRLFHEKKKKTWLIKSYDDGYKGILLLDE